MEKNTKGDLWEGYTKERIARFEDSRVDKVAVPGEDKDCSIHWFQYL